MFTPAQLESPSGRRAPRAPWCTGVVSPEMPASLVIPIPHAPPCVVPSFSPTKTRFHPLNPANITKPHPTHGRAYCPTHHGAYRPPDPNNWLFNHCETHKQRRSDPIASAAACSAGRALRRSRLGLKGSANTGPVNPPAASARNIARASMIPVAIGIARSRFICSSRVRPLWASLACTMYTRLASNVPSCSTAPPEV